jgi:predicted RNA-binding Zn-ribbon protein involved in translation (DUF1610 family)
MVQNSVQSTCPKCRSGYIGRSHRSALEAALSITNLFPYRCDACGKRFFLFGKYRARPEDRERQRSA